MRFLTSTIRTYITLKGQEKIIDNCSLIIGLEFPGEEHRHLHGDWTLCGCVFSLWIQHYAAFACPAAVVVSDVDHGESAHATCAAAQVADKVGHIGGLPGLILHGALAVDYDAYRHSVTICHEGVGASYSDAADGAGGVDWGSGGAGGIIRSVHSRVHSAEEALRRSWVCLSQI